MKDLKEFIRNVPDFPKAGIVFKDITPLLASAEAFASVVDSFAGRNRDRVDFVLGIESRGFTVGAAVAYSLGAGLVIARKPGKLPAATYQATYELEYGSDALEIHQDAFPAGSRVLVVDDLLATGGTARAAVELVEKLKGQVVEVDFIIELAFLKGRERLKSYPVHSLLRYSDE